MASGSQGAQRASARGMLGAASAGTRGGGAASGGVATAPTGVTDRRGAAGECGDGCGCPVGVRRGACECGERALSQNRTKGAQTVLGIKSTPYVFVT